MTLTNRLKELRSERRLSQEELSKTIGIPRTTYSGYENGSREPDHDMLQKFADFYGVTIDYLMGRTDQREMKVTANQKHRLDEILRMNDVEFKNKGLDEKQRKQLLKLIETFLMDDE